MTLGNDISQIAGSLIDGVLLTQLKQISDERGAVLHMLRSDAPDFTQFGECYFSEVVTGCVKGWKCHELQTQNIAVPRGRIKLVIYDRREKSASQGIIQEFELGRPDAYFRISIPPGIWYAFSCISDETALLVNCADVPHDPGECKVLEMRTREIPYKW